MRLVLLINHWGGVPHCLHSNAAQGHLRRARGRKDRLRRARSATGDEEEEAEEEGEETTTTTVVESLLLSHTDPSEEFLSASRDFWDAANSAAGCRTACFGARGTFHRPVRVDDGATESLPDPRRALVDSLGVEACSTHDAFHPHDDASSFFASDAADEATCEEAERFVEEQERAGTEGTVVVCVNLLSCRDVVRARFGAATSTPSESCFVLRTGKRGEAEIDPRVVPPSLRVALDGVTAPLSSANRRRFGEAETTGGAVVETTPVQFAALLRLAASSVDRSVDRTASLVSRALATDEGVVAVTASHSLPLGEHGLRDGGGPTRCCCSTFWADTLPPPRSPSSWRTTLRDRLRSFAASIFGQTPLPRRLLGAAAAAEEEEAPCCVVTSSSSSSRSGSDPTTSFYRVVVRLRDRTYALIGRRGGGGGGTIVAAFDLDLDPGEEEDVSLSLRTHTPSLRDELDAAFARSVARRTTTTAPPPPPSAPSVSRFSLSRDAREDLLRPPPVLVPPRTPSPPVPPAPATPPPPKRTTTAVPQRVAREEAGFPVPPSTTSSSTTSRRAAASLRGRESKLHALHR